MQFYRFSSSIVRRMVQDWIFLALILALLLLIKNLVVRINFNFEDMVVDANSFVSAKSEYRIHINLDEQSMYVFKNDELYKTYLVSGGKAGTPSPIGEWVIIHKARWGDSYGGAWLGLNVPWVNMGSWHQNPVGNWTRECFHGCIRMKMKMCMNCMNTFHMAQEWLSFMRTVLQKFEGWGFWLGRVSGTKALKQLGYFHN